MIKNYPFVAMILVLLAGICFIIFIMFTYAYENPDSGLFTKLDESASETMSTENYNWFSDIVDHVKTGIGFGGVFLLTLAIIIAAALLLMYKNKKELLHVKKIEKNKIKLKKLGRLDNKKAKYLSQLRTLNEALRLKTVSKKSYNTAKRRIEEEIKKLNKTIKGRVSKI